jgi:natural product precursor
MKQLGKLKLNRLSDVELNEKELNRILGGGTPGDCCCGCNYASSGGSSSSANDSANNASGLHSPGCGSGGGDGSIIVMSNYSCDRPVNCNNEPSKC